jgi:hypothetical protein
VVSKAARLAGAALDLLAIADLEDKAKCRSSVDYCSAAYR